ncbi:4-phosphoerythronate dehydrogenase (FAD-dependent) [Tistlia consotensis]|uniref:4-phosphoerythronate dehydrogenase (FAD-dependent) n=1 Tax=Tistlia consotensis USBA 355 TaxID=560819 RepID=A0A1Y6B7K5_9PROT|nr:FAD-binding oxidoreductase [Tistlia consotensis]SME97169.1 4-phosphoerythronate dehydrogenase (FAD-dependent) [Tistlia consotensis USBA 355]SNR56590.1 4-phosphoerythronate dehydrogenase (FAD-dependent) [Tistlia consotensis]
MTARPIPEPFENLHDRILDVVGEEGVVAEAGEMARYLAEERGRFVGKAAFVVRPANTREVAEVVKLCAEAGIGIVPQGGNTSMVGGSIPFEEGDEIVLSLERLNRIRALDADNFTMTVEAGVILQEVQQAAAAADRLFPLSLGAEGSCRIGGNISTNAGGVQVLRYGNTRELVLGLEVVLPDGRIWDGLRALRKDNTGYDLKQLFIGAEGSLGIVTAAVLKLYARPREIVTAFVAVPDPAAALALLSRLRGASGESVTSFEILPRLGLEFTLRHIEGCRDPLEAAHPWYVLVELFGGREDGGLRELLEEALAEALEGSLVLDATLAETEAKRRELWRLREAMSEAQKFEGGSIKHDVSVPVSSVPAFIAEAGALVTELIPGCRPVPFGHLGDGNIHFNVSQPLPEAGGDFAPGKAAYLARWDEMNRAVHDLVVRRFHGSISAEHGIGRMKLAENERFKSAVELDLLRTVKKALDPHGIMNRGKVV